MKKINLVKFEEARERKEMAECTFSPQTNSPPERVFSPKAFKRLHYNETELRHEKMCQKEAEKLDKFKQEYTFKPERSKTRRHDSSANKENDESQLFERLYKVHFQKEEKL